MAEQGAGDIQRMLSAMGRIGSPRGAELVVSPDVEGPARRELERLPDGHRPQLVVDDTLPAGTARMRPGGGLHV